MKARAIGALLNDRYWNAKVGKSTALRIEQFIFRMKRSKLLKITPEGYIPAEGFKLNGAFQQSERASQPYRLEVHVRLIIGGRANLIPIEELPNLRTDIEKILALMQLTQGKGDES